MLGGPSRSLPTSADLLPQIHVKRYHECLSASIADRKDFYTQFFVTDEKASCNAMFPVITAKELCHTRAFVEYQDKFGTSKQRKKREAEGDFLHGARTPVGSWAS